MTFIFSVNIFLGKQCSGFHRYTQFSGRNTPHIVPTLMNDQNKNCTENNKLVSGLRKTKLTKKTEYF